MRHKPDSVPLRGAIICLCGQNPEFKRRGQRLIPYLALLREGLALPAQSLETAAGSYPAFSPLPLARRFVFCCTVRTRALRRAPRPFGRNPALWCPDFPPADEPRANARPKFSKNSRFLYRRIRNFRKPRPIFAEIKGLLIRIASAIARAAKISSGL